MRAVLVTVGSRGDVAPFLALARRLTDEGHQAALVTHQSLLPPRVAGVDLIGVGGDPAALMQGPAAVALKRGDIRGLNRTRGEFADLLTSVVEPTRAALPGADVLIASTFATAAVEVARAQGVPVVRAHLWPENAQLDGPMPVLPYSWRLPAPIRRAARWGLRRMEPLLAGFDGWWEGGRLRIVAHHGAGFTTTDQASLHAYSPAVAPRDAVDPTAVVTGWWTDPTPGSLSESTRALLASPGPPWVHLGFGSMPTGSPDRLEDVVAAVCRDLGVRALLQIPDARRRSGSGVHVIGPEPHALLFRHVRAVVHHGGSGTTAAAVTAGVPSVVVPHLADQFYWGHRLHRLGVAPRPIPRFLLSRRGLSQALTTAMGESMAERARGLGATVRAEDGTGEAVRRLEAIVAAHRDRSG